MKNSLLKPLFEITSFAVPIKSDNSRLSLLLMLEFLASSGIAIAKRLDMLKERKRTLNPDNDITMLDMSGPITNASDNAVE
jgi:hypothetical protein